MSSVDEVKTTIGDIQNQTNDILGQGEGFDGGREAGGFIFFIIPLFWVAFPILGLFCKQKWWFKLLSDS